MEGAADSAAERSVRVEGELDARFLLLCCPGLEQARQALQVRALSRAGPHPARGELSGRPSPCSIPAIAASPGATSR